MGFNPRSDDWVDEMTAAVVENFFYAVHHKKLAVEITAEGKSVAVNHETLDGLFTSVPKEKASERFHYYKAIRDESPDRTPKLQRIGALDVYASVGSGNRRMAYVNRNGMLISDSKEMKSNPVFPRGRSLWPDYAVVAVPASDSGDKWIRAMENPSHDSISMEQLTDAKDRRQAERAFKSARDAIKRIIDERAETHTSGDTSNLNELASVFPELDPDNPGNTRLQTREIETPKGQQGAFDIDIDSGVGETAAVIDGGAGEEDGDGIDVVPVDGGGGGGGGNGNGGGGHSTGGADGGGKKSSPRRFSMNDIRVMRVGAQEIVVAFTPGGELPFAAKFALMPAGEEHRSESRIRIVDASVVGNPPKGSARALVEGGALTFTSDSNDRVAVRIALEDSADGLAFRLGHLK